VTKFSANIDRSDSKSKIEGEYMLKTVIAAAVLMAGTATGAYAHATLEAQEANVGGAYKAVMRIGHGCEGKPTLKVIVQVPEGMFGVKPMPKAGWTLETVKGKYAKSYDYFGTPMSEGVKEIIWSGGSLPDEHYDEFVFRGTLSADLPTGVKIYFPTVQECPDGAVHRWIEIPADGKTADDYEEPAPGLMLNPKQ